MQQETDKPLVENEKNETAKLENRTVVAVNESVTKESNRVVRKYGHIESVFDERDHRIHFDDSHVEAFRKVNPHVRINNSVFDLRTIVELPKVLSDINQGNLGSCTANAIAFAYAFDEIKQKNTNIFLPSRLFIYYNERLMENTVGRDNGAQMRTGIKSLNTYGVCSEHQWIYDPTKFAKRPPQSAYDIATKAKAVSYASIDFATNDITKRVEQLKKSLQSGFPFVFGIIVYKSFESDLVAKTGVVPMPSSRDRRVGGHAVCAVGFDDSKRHFIVKNSWGADWGVNGYFYLPYEYAGSPTLALDFWVIRQVTNPLLPGFKPSNIAPISANLYAKVSI